MVQKLLTPTDEVFNEHKKKQLMELAALNGKGVHRCEILLTALILDLRDPIGNSTRSTELNYPSYPLIFSFALGQSRICLDWFHLSILSGTLRDQDFLALQRSAEEKGEVYQLPDDVKQRVEEQYKRDVAAVHGQVRVHTLYPTRDF